jgi:hypothetical protein
MIYKGFGAFIIKVCVVTSDIIIPTIAQEQSHPNDEKDNIVSLSLFFFAHSIQK